jgi:hypothetical protein
MDKKLLWKRIFIGIGILIVLGILACAGLFLAGVALGQFDWLGLSIYISKREMNTNTYPTITNFDVSSSSLSSSVSLKWDGVGNFSNGSGFTDPVTNNDLSTNQYGYAIVPVIDGKIQYTTGGNSNVVFVPYSTNDGNNTYTLTSSDITTMGISLTQPGLAFYVVPYAQYYYMGQPGSQSTIGGSPEKFNNFDKSSSMVKITKLKLHKPMYVRGPDSLKNLNTSTKAFHHGPKAGLFLDNTQDKNDVFQAPF